MVPTVPSQVRREGLEIGNHTAATNNITDATPTGLATFVRPDISCTPLQLPYWLINMGSRLAIKAADKIIFFFITGFPFRKELKFMAYIFSIAQKIRAAKELFQRCVSAGFTLLKKRIHSTINRVPAVISAQPIRLLAVNGSRRTINASTSVITTLSLSMGTTLQASPICKAR